MPGGRRDDELQRQLRERIRQLRDRAWLSNSALQRALEETAAWQGQFERVLHDRSRALSIKLLDALDLVFAGRLPEYPVGALTRQARGGGAAELDAFLGHGRHEAEPTGATDDDAATPTGDDGSWQPSEISVGDLSAGSTCSCLDDGRAGGAGKVSAGTGEQDVAPDGVGRDSGPQDANLGLDDQEDREPRSSRDRLDDTGDATAAASAADVDAPAQRSRRRLMLIIAATTATVIASTLGGSYWRWLHPVSEVVVGTVACASGSDVRGVWVRTHSDRLSGWAELSRRDTSSTNFRARVPAGEPYKVHVGCTGTGEVWLDNRSSYVTDTGHTFTYQDDEKWVTEPPYYGPCVAG